MHVAAGGVLGGPDAYGIFRNGVEIPDLLAGLGIIGADEAADAVFAAIGADQDLVLDHGRRHRLAIAEFGIGNVGDPDDLARLGVQRDQLGIERREIDLVVKNLDAAIVRAAAENRDRPHLVIVVPELLAGLGVKRVDMAERGRHIHHAIDDDRRRLERFLDVGLEDPGDMQALDVVAIDLLGGIKTRLGVIAVGEQKILEFLSAALSCCWVTGGTLALPSVDLPSWLTSCPLAAADKSAKLPIRTTPAASPFTYFMIPPCCCFWICCDETTDGQVPY